MKRGEPTLSPARAEAFRVLVRVVRDDAYAAPLLATSRIDLLSVEDRHLVNELVLGVLRWRGELDYIINQLTERAAEKLDLPVRVALWLGLYQLRHLDRIPAHAAVSESVALVRRGASWRAAGLVNATLRGYSRKPPEVPGPHVREPLNRLSIALSHPRWLLARWQGLLGVDEAASLAQANLAPAPVAFRVNTLRAPSVARVLAELDSAGVAVRSSDVAAGGFVVVSGAIAPRSRVVARGWIAIQDEASQLVSELLAARPGERILDIGAAPGGKATALAAAMANQGEVVAVELHQARAEVLAESAERLAARIVRPLVADATQPLPFAPGTAFDAVLVDAPCSGTGTLRRNPEIKWRLREADLAACARTQSALLAEASRWLRPGGRLVYSTCSLERVENEEVVEAFLASHPDFEPVNAPQRFRVEGGGFRTFPHRHGCDGFFGVEMRARRTPSEPGPLGKGTACARC